MLRALQCINSSTVQNNSTTDTSFILVFKRRKLRTKDHIVHRWKVTEVGLVEVRKPVPSHTISQHCFESQPWALFKSTAQVDFLIYNFSLFNTEHQFLSFCANIHIHDLLFSLSHVFCSMNYALLLHLHSSGR